MADDARRTERLCNRAWEHFPARVNDQQIYEEDRPNFMAVCYKHARDSYGMPPNSQCFWQFKDNTFVFSRNGQMIPMSEKSSVSCLVMLSRAELWWTGAKKEEPKKEEPKKEEPKKEESKKEEPKKEESKKEEPKKEEPKKEESKEEGPKKEGPKKEESKEEGPKKEESKEEGAPADGGAKKPGGEKSDEKAEGDRGPEGKAMESPQATPPGNAPLTLWPRWTVQAGGGFNFTQTGLSRNGEAPVVPVQNEVYGSVKMGRLLTPVTLGNRWAYTTSITLQGDYLPFPAKTEATRITVWGVGPEISGLLYYELVKGGARLVFGPYLGALVGALSTKECMDVGVPGKCYEATGQRTVGQLKAGATVGIETRADEGAPSLMVFLATGLRHFIHGDQIRNSGDFIQFGGTTFDAVNFFVGLNY